MDNKISNIPTPLKQQWRRIRYQLLPVVTMCLAIMAVAWLWRRHGSVVNGVGEAIANEANLNAARQGVLIALPDNLRSPRPDAYVDADDLIARMDPAPVVAALSLLKLDVDQVRKTMPRFGGVPSVSPGYYATFMASIEGQRLAVLESSAQDRIDYPNRRRGRRTFEDSEETAAARNELARSQLAHAMIRHFVTLPEQFDRQLISCRTQVDAIEARLRDLEFQAGCLEIRAPFRGRLVHVYRYPGQFVQAGDVVAAVIASDVNIIRSYVRQEQNVKLTKGTWVEVRPRIPGSPAVQGTIEQIGAKVESIPAKHLRDPKTPEFGTPVEIRPAQQQTFELHPGSVVDLKFLVSQN